MKKGKRPYKSTRNITIRDVPKSYAQMFNFIHELSEEASGGEQSKTEFFNQVVMSIANYYLGEEQAQEMLKFYQDREIVLEKASLRKALQETTKNEPT